MREWNDSAVFMAFAFASVNFPSSSDSWTPMESIFRVQARRIALEPSRASTSPLMRLRFGACSQPQLLVGTYNSALSKSP